MYITGKYNCLIFKEDDLDDNRIKGIIASVGIFSYCAIMPLKLETKMLDLDKPVEGVKLNGNVKPDLLILDGQQRITFFIKRL